MCYPAAYGGGMERVGVRELRQNASALLADVEHGDEIVVTVQNREVAMLVPVPRRTWVTRESALSVYSTDVDLAWPQEVVETRRGEQRSEDPWETPGRRG